MSFFPSTPTAQQQPDGSISDNAAVTSDKISTEVDAPKSALDDAFAKAVRSLANDMPLLMHGSGDVAPDQTNPESVQLLASLTVQYIAHLVDAALDCQAMLRDGGNKATAKAARKPTALAAGGTKGYHMPVPPPACFPRSRNPPIPPVPESRHAKRKLHRSVDEYWDEPLPEPKIVKKKLTVEIEAEQKQREEEFFRQLQKRSYEDEEEELRRNKEDIHIDQWVGLTGVDLAEESRIRNAYVRGGPAALTTQSFVFPICHDVYAYGRVMEVQTVKQTLVPILQDPAVVDMIRSEEERLRDERRKLKKKLKKQKKMAAAKAGGGTSDPEDEDEEDVADDDDHDEGGLAWPGLDALLPVHRSGDWPFDLPGGLAKLF